MDGKGVNLKIVIGRTNPPHDGHIALMTAAITAAKEAPGPIKCALILLGNGPEGQRTNEDPIDHHIKSEFLTRKLSAVSADDGTSFVDGVDFVVMQMNTSEEGGASGNILEFLKKFISVDYSNSISIVQFTGNKPGKISKTRKRGLSDPAKHMGLRAYIQRRIREEYTQAADVTCGYYAVPTEIISGKPPMSATKVREDAVKCFLAAADSDDARARGHTCWTQQYPFYKDDSEPVSLSKQMFDAIIDFKDTPYKKTKRTREDDHVPASLTFVVSKAAKHEPTTRLLATGLPATGLPGGSRRKHTRRRASNLRNKKTLRTNRRHNKHRHTRRRT